MQTLSNPTEKATELYEKMFLVPNINGVCTMTKSVAKKCALIALNEILEHHDSLFDLGLKNVHQTFETPTEIYNNVMNPAKNYLKQVKKEIEKL